MKTTRVTRQKEAILRAALHSGDHPTADMIYAEVRRELPRVSLGTVYRNLQKLVGEGRLSLAAVPDEGGRSARFDPETRPHDHFVCESCQRIYDIARKSEGGALDLRSFAERGFRVTSHTLAVYGVCDHCEARRGASNAGRRPAAK